MLVVERRHQPDVRRQQHAVAEHVARHVADSRYGKLLTLNIHAQFAEVPFDALPGAARGDAHLLVVVAGGSAGRERICEPEPALYCDGVRDIRERRRTLVGGNDEVRVVAVGADHTRR